MINFVKKRRLWYSFSIFVIFIGFISMAINFVSINHFFNLGIDFTGGTSIILRFEKSNENIEQTLRLLLSDVGLEKNTIQRSGDQDIIIKTEEMNVEIRRSLFDAIEKRIGSFDVLEVDIIGPSIGEQLRNVSIVIVLCVSIAILLYCSWRFELIFGLASIVALLHDALILLSLTAILKLEMNTAYIAALLTVLGYSINDTIVIFDRIREKFKSVYKEETTRVSKSLMNKAINEMLPRSVHTSITTGLVVLSIFFIGGLSLKVFSTVLFIGLLTGTYSSLFIASPMVVTISKLKGAKIDQ